MTATEEGDEIIRNAEAAARRKEISLEALWDIRRQTMLYIYDQGETFLCPAEWLYDPWKVEEKDEM